MKKIYFQAIIIFLAILPVFISCKKDADTVEPVKTNTELLTFGSWKLTAATINSENNGITDMYAEMDNCAKDDIMTFKTNNTFVADEGATKCNTDDPQTELGTWIFSTDEKIITVDDDSYPIKTLSSTTFIIEWQELEDDLVYTYTITFKH